MVEGAHHKLERGGRFDSTPGDQYYGVSKMSEMSHDYPPEPVMVEMHFGDYETAAYITDRLIQSGITFECTPHADTQTCTIRIPETNRVYAEQQLQERNKVLHVHYKGHSIKCYGHMFEDQNTWWATEDDEGIHTNGFKSWNEAVVFFIDKCELPVVELAAV